MPPTAKSIKSKVAENPKWSIGIYQIDEEYKAIFTMLSPQTKVLESPRLYNSPEEAQTNSPPPKDKWFKTLQSGIFVAAAAATASLVQFQPNQTDWSAISAIFGFTSGAIGSIWLNRPPQKKL